MKYYFPVGLNYYQLLAHPFIFAFILPQFYFSTKEIKGKKEKQTKKPF